MPKVRKIDWSFDEWIAGTQGMTLEEEGLYSRIINRLYSAGGELPADERELAILCNVRPQTWRRVWPQIRQKFRETSGKLGQNRVKTELFLAETRMKVAENAAFERWKRRNNNDMPNAVVKNSAMPSPSPSPSLEEREANASPKKTRRSAASYAKPTTNGAANGAAKRGHRLPVDWEPSDEDRDFARSLGLDPAEVLAEFRDYWLDRATDATRIGWSGTYRNRCRMLAKRSSANGLQSGDPAARAGDRTAERRSPLAAAVARRLAPE